VALRQVRRGRLVLGVANGQVFADGACVYLAKDLKVALVTSGE
jgi:3-hydroxyacyl-[acyl-carrier protein] dehydratase/trans-2-decenoyl-[acyl-carrier protein] isomerase